jgi:hypothetical protein
MRQTIEDVFRNHLSDKPECLTEALDSVLPQDPTNDDPATRLTRQLYFESAKFGDEEAPAFCEQLPSMGDHGVRQVALASAVLNSGEVADRLPSWFDRRLFGQAALVADAGLAFVGRKEVETVHRFGPKYGPNYGFHPAYGYDMAQGIMTELGTQDDPSSQFIACFMARHHMVQAKHAYGLEWYEVKRGPDISEAQVDMAVLLEKPFDYFDDAFGRRGDDANTFDQQATTPVDRFTESMGMLFAQNLSLVGAMESQRFDPALPGIIARRILEVVLERDPLHKGVDEVYRQLRPDLTLATAKSA